MKKAIGYVRVSTEEQSGDDKYGIEIQKQAILSYALTMTTKLSSGVSM